MSTVEQNYHRLLSNPSDVVMSASEATEIWKVMLPEHPVLFSRRLLKAHRYLETTDRRFQAGWAL